MGAYEVAWRAHHRPHGRHGTLLRGLLPAHDPKPDVTDASPGTNFRVPEKLMMYSRAIARSQKYFSVERIRQNLL